MRKQFLRRLSDNDRLKVLKAKTEASMDICERLEFDIRLRQAAKFVMSIIMPKRLDTYFRRWVGRARWFKHKRLAMEKAHKYYNDHTVTSYLRFWRDWAKRPMLKVRVAGRWWCVCHTVCGHMA